MIYPTRIAVLDALLRRQEIDILLVQEVTYDVLNDFQGYTTQYNIGANRRGTAIVAWDGINLENIIMSPSGRAMAATFREIWIIIVYAPSGTAMKQKQEHFFNSELPYLLTGETGHIWQYGIGVERGTGCTDHDTTPKHPVVYGVVERTRSMVIEGI